MTNDAIANMRSIAEARGRNVDWAVSTVESRGLLAGIGGRRRRARSMGSPSRSRTSVARPTARSWRSQSQPVTVDIADAPFVDLSMNPFQSIIHLLSDPNVAFILLTLGFYGLLFELQSPNFVTGILGAIALILAFIGFGSLPLNVAGLLLIALAVVLFLLEFTVTSHGLLAVGGLICFVLGAFTLYTAPGAPTAPDVTVAAPARRRSWRPSRRAGSRSCSSRSSPRGVGLAPWAGAYGAGGTSAVVPLGVEAVAKSRVSPVGVVYALGEEWTARNEADTDIEPGQHVRVVGHDGLTLLVEPGPRAGGRRAGGPVQEKRRRPTDGAGIRRRDRGGRWSSSRWSGSCASSADGSRPADQFGAGGRSTVPAGTPGFVKSALAPSGIVSAAGEDWSARSRTGATIAPGARVTVIGQDGLTLIVEAGLDAHRDAGIRRASMELLAVGVAVLFLVIVGLLLFFAAIKIVNQYERLLIFTLGRTSPNEVKGPGWVFVVPIVQRGVRVDLREQFIEVPSQTNITKDNAPISIDFLIYWRIADPYKSVVEVQNFNGALQNIATTTLRAVIGDILLDDVLSKREQINEVLRVKMDEVTARWGGKVTTVEIREITPPRDVQDAMNRQLSAERTRRAVITESEGARQSAINVAEGEKQAAILKAEGDRQAAILRAEGFALALQKIFETASGVDQKTMALQYLEAFKALGQSPSTKYILPLEVTQLAESFRGLPRRARTNRGRRRHRRR